MKKLLFALAVLLAFAPATLTVADEAPAVDLEVAVDLEADVTIDTGTEITVAAELAEALPRPVLDEVLETAARAYECPWYSTYCRRDRDCDAYCGAPSAGACFNGCCACYF